jgi:hypothetical protein
LNNASFLARGAHGTIKTRPARRLPNRQSLHTAKRGHRPNSV